ncbi:MAG: DUF1893 domain-containing protein [Eubacteriaceae bacterium]
MADIDVAKQLLKDCGYKCVLAKGDVIRISEKRGVAPMMEFIDAGMDLNGFSAADKVVGKAVALLFVLAGISEVYAETISSHAIAVLEKNNIPFSFNTSVEHIINRFGDGLCPMEEATLDIDDPQEAYDAICAKLEELNSQIDID